MQIDNNFMALFPDFISDLFIMFSIAVGRSPCFVTTKSQVIGLSSRQVVSLMLQVVQVFADEAKTIRLGYVSHLLIILTV